MRTGERSIMRRICALTGCLIAGYLIAGTLLIPVAGAEPLNHQDIWLKNEQGDRITPQENRFDPYSPKKTCGVCHGYATITKGYHFQQGFDVMSDKYDPKRPWVLSPGMYGKWLPYAAAGRAAAKENTDSRQIDLSAYDWIGGGKLNPAKKIKSPACGWCHPGGGPLEYGRTPEGRADLSRNLAQAEGGSTSPHGWRLQFPLHAGRPEPFPRERRRRSGLPDLSPARLSGWRSAMQQLAAIGTTVGPPRQGPVSERSRGAVFAYDRSRRRPRRSEFPCRNLEFLDEARRDVQLVRPAPLHGGGTPQGGPRQPRCRFEKLSPVPCRGGREEYGDDQRRPHDAHAKAGLRCTDCHPLTGRTAGERLGHQIAKGSYPQLSVRDDLDGVGMKTCIGCHKERQYSPSGKGMPKAAPDPEKRHAERLPKATFHTSIITCNGCHTTAQPARGMALLDLSAGLELGFTADAYLTVAWPDDYDAAARVPWSPWMTRARGGRDTLRLTFPIFPSGSSGSANGWRAV